jgi:hypothetical protein
MTTTATGVQMGFEAKLFYCGTGIGGTPTWTEAQGVKDCTLTVQGKEVDISTRRGNGFQATGVGLIDAGIEFDMPMNPSDPAFQAFETAFFSRNTIGLAAMSGPMTTINSRGLWADCVITKFDRDENLEGAQVVKVTAKPTDSANAPQWKVIGA